MCLQVADCTTQAYNRSPMSDDPLQPHSHDNNELPPNDDPTLIVIRPNGEQTPYSLTTLATLPQSQLTYSFSTDHGTHGPYQLSGVALRDLIGQDAVGEIEVMSADGFGNRIFAEELGDGNRPILLCTHSDGQPLRRENGLVRLVVPSETDNALRQIKWVRSVRLI